MANRRRDARGAPLLPLQMIDSRAAARTDGRMIGILPLPPSLTRPILRSSALSLGVSEVDQTKGVSQVDYPSWPDTLYFLSRWSKWPPSPSDGLSCVNMCLPPSFVSPRSVTMSSRVTFHLRPLPLPHCDDHFHIFAIIFVHFSLPQ